MSLIKYKMRKLSVIVICLCCFISLKGISDTAPITTVGAITNATTGFGGVIVPVTVVNFVSIGWIKLTLTYDTTKVKYVSFTPDPAFPGMTVTYFPGTNNPTAKIVISWIATTNITLPDQTHLLDLTYTYLTATAPLTWSTSGTNCQYKRYVSGSTYTLLTDSPKSAFYINGGISNRAAPVTIAPVIANAITGDYPIPITVYNFTNIGSFYLILEYDAATMTYLNNYTLNPDLPCGIAIGTQISQNGKMLLTMSWYCLSVSGSSLPDGSTLISLDFHYTNVAGSGSYSTLNWYQGGPPCSYHDVLSSIKLIDFPTADYYKNGLIHSSGHYAPQTWLLLDTNAIPGSLSLPVITNNFTDVQSFRLSFNYDPTVMTYNGFTPNPSLGDSMTVVNNAPDGSGKRKLAISWNGTSLQALTDGSTLVTLNYTYISGTSALAWVTDTASCRFNEANGNAYYDLPKSDYYRDGVVTSHAAPITAAWYSIGVVNQTVTVPVKVYHFSNIGSFSLTMDYDPGVLTYLSADPHPSIGGSFTASPQGTGRILLAWSGDPASLTDSSNLLNVSFTYLGNTSPLAWYTAGTSCKYTEGDTSLPALYDSPKASYYINGSVGPNPVIANFSASNVTPDVNETVTFTDLSAGSPNGWNWSFSPQMIVYVNGTSSSFQNPQVKFTTNGNYTVTLIASRGISSNLKIRPYYIHAGPTALWTGITSADWNTFSNWNNNLVPGNITNVRIPSSGPPNWPLFSGNLILGTHCNTLTLMGAAQLTVTGSFTINAGSVLTFTGSGAMKVGGNWSDFGSFIPGTGSVEFFGPNPGSILAPVYETFFNLIENKSGTTLTIPNNVIVNGDVTLK